MALTDTEIGLYAKVGLQHCEIERQQSAYNALIAEFARVLSGEVDPSRVMVNLTDGSWLRTPAGESPPTPATFNGVPVVVVGKQQTAARDLLRLVAQIKSGEVDPQCLAIDETAAAWALLPVPVVLGESVTEAVA